MEIGYHSRTRKDETGFRWFDDIVTRTALGRELRRARHAPGGARVDLVEQEYDRLGRVAKLRRYLQPAVATAAVTWHSEFDSLGRRLTLTEPGMSTRHSRYDESGNERATDHAVVSWKAAFSAAM